MSGETCGSTKSKMQQNINKRDNLIIFFAIMFATPFLMKKLGKVHLDRDLTRLKQEKGIA